MRAGYIILIATFVLLAAASYFYYPVYVSPRPLCDLYVEQKSHVGAVVIVTGRVYGAWDGRYFMASRCTGGIMYLGLDVPTFVAASPMSRYALDQLTTEKSVRATVVGRVAAEGGGCFGPATVLTAMAVNVSGPVEPVSAGSAALP